jgi:hypothetical protein
MWAPEPVWTQALEEKSFAPAGERTWLPSLQSVTILTELPQLLHKTVHNVMVLYILIFDVLENRIIILSN